MVRLNNFQDIALRAYLLGAFTPELTLNAMYIMESVGAEDMGDINLKGICTEKDSYSIPVHFEFKNRLKKLRGEDES